MEAILALYRQPYNPKQPLVCFDEKSIQLLAHIRQAISMKPGQAARQDYEYKRNGTRNLFLFVEPKAGKRCVLVTKQRKKEQFAHAMRYLVDVLYPDAERIHVVMDNLNTHHYHSLVEFFGKTEADQIWNRICIHFTPAHGSWLNMAEIELSIMSRQCLQCRLPDEWTLQMQLLAWEQYSNEAERKIHWSFIVDDARRVFKEHYPANLEI
jgi:transposase